MALCDHGTQGTRSPPEIEVERHTTHELAQRGLSWKGEKQEMSSVDVKETATQKQQTPLPHDSAR